LGHGAPLTDTCKEQNGGLSVLVVARGGWISTVPGAFVLVLFLDQADIEHRLGRARVASAAAGEL
tara:strand:+ start:424 stop:618 length:195 start_codon:yes stop_codon:yes gene_type:complete